jgi:hypothetical protein
VLAVKHLQLVELDDLHELSSKTSASGDRLTNEYEEK